MRKVTVLLIVVLWLALTISSVAAETDFDPSVYSTEELLDIVTEIYDYIPKTPNGEVLCDVNGIYRVPRNLRILLFELYRESLCG